MTIETKFNTNQEVYYFNENTKQLCPCEIKAIRIEVIVSENLLSKNRLVTRVEYKIDKTFFSGDFTPEEKFYESKEDFIKQINIGQ